MSIEENLKSIQARIEKAALAVGRNPQEIELVAVIKKVPTELVFQALAAGVKAVGENRIQEAHARYKTIREKFPQVSYHMIGHLQRNKVGQALDMFDIILSVDSARLMEEINQRATKIVPILIEVNTSGEASKFGIEPEKTIELARCASSLDKIKVRGLMTIGPLTPEPEKIRSSFRKLKELRDQIAGGGFPGVEMKYLSMGMSDDFELAIEEGSNLLRIGRAIFGLPTGRQERR